MAGGLNVERTCTVVHGEGEGDSQPLSSLRDRDAYVLLGAPGAGKTVAFEHEACGRESCVRAMVAALARCRDVRRVRHVARFFVGHEWSETIGNLGADALGMLVQAVGGSYGPVRRKSGRTYVVTTDMEVEAAVRDWIGVLAPLPSRRATEILDELGADGSLSGWARELRHARTVRLEARRNATFSHASMEEVLGTFDGAKAANVGDVAALTVELLGALARQIRDGSTSDWRQYWKTGFEEPEHEDTCRDWLVSDLRHDLERYGLHGEEEGQYAEDKRSDIKVFGAGGAVPVEIKKSNHVELWTAIRTQLMAKYMRDPKADGYGIYLVLWLGEELCTKDGSGEAVKSAGASAAACRADAGGEAQAGRLRSRRLTTLRVVLPGFAQDVADNCTVR